MNLPADPPCWCQEKKYPPIAVWESDYLDRHPEQALSNKIPKPNPFTHKRDDGWICPKKGIGYSAPWNEFPAASCLDAKELLGPADEAIEKLQVNEVCISAFKKHGTTVNEYLGLK